LEQYINKVNKNYDTIEKYLKNVDKFKFKSLEDFEDNFNDYLAVSIPLFTILNALIEVGESLIELKKLEFPTLYGKILLILSKELGKNYHILCIKKI